MRIFAKDVTIKTVHRFESCSSRLGRLLKWTTRADCKSAGIAFAGSNPSDSVLPNPTDLARLAVVSEILKF